jgi:hypothetical protein
MQRGPPSWPVLQPPDERFYVPQTKLAGIGASNSGARLLVILVYRGFSHSQESITAAPRLFP